MSRHLHWFRSDLRLFDNPALYAASQAAKEQGEGSLLTCFIFCPQQWQAHDMAPIQVELMRQSLQCLQVDLAELNIPLLFAACDGLASVPETMLRLMRQHEASVLHFNEEYPVNERQRDAAVVAQLQAEGLDVKRYQDQCIVAPGQVLTKAGKPFTVFTPFKRAWRVYVEQFWPTLWPRPAPQRSLSRASHHSSAAERDGKAVNANGDRIEGYERVSLHIWRPGEAAAQDSLAAFAEDGLLFYKSRRDFPALNGTSQLSPYLALGILSPRQAFMTAYSALQEHPAHTTDIETWINELVWRDFYIHIVQAFPRVSRHKPFQVKTDGIAWRTSEADFTAWSLGKTGIPIVDAAMRQLNQTGWMHNRLRMITATFLCKNLLIDWRWGERYFSQHLIDGFLPSNNGGWQWCASTGTDASPFFRVFNPVTQGQKFDPKGDFVRHYVPELKSRPLKLLHQPLTEEELKLGLYDYPPAIVDLKSSRERAIAAFRQLNDRPPPVMQKIKLADKR